MAGNYTEPLPAYGDVFRVAEYLQQVESGMFIDYDGHGHPVKDGMMDPSIDIKPSKPELIPEDATDIIWFNK